MQERNKFGTKPWANVPIARTGRSLISVSWTLTVQGETASYVLRCLVPCSGVGDTAGCTPMIDCNLTSLVSFACKAGFIANFLKGI